MLRLPFRLPAAALTALALAGCGSGTGDERAAREVAAPLAKSTGPMAVAPVDGRLGDATTASSTHALRELPVGPRRVDPDVPKHGVGAGAACADQELLPAAETLAAVSAATLCLVNGERADAGLPPLAQNARLEASAAAHSADMVQASYFAHQSLDGRVVTDRVRATGYIPGDRRWTVGENLAWGTGTMATPGAIVKAWMESQGHRENVLRASFSEAGLGIALGNPRSGDGQGATYTMNLGAVSASVAQPAGSATTPARSSRPTSTRRAAAKRRKSCRARARRLRVSPNKRKARMARCARAARVRR